MQPETRTAYVVGQFSLEEQKAMTPDEYEKTAEYWLHFMSEISKMTKDNYLFTPSAQDKVLAEELRLRFREKPCPMLTDNGKKWYIEPKPMDFTPKKCRSRLWSALNGNALRRGYDSDKVEQIYGSYIEEMFPIEEFRENH